MKNLGLLVLILGIVTGCANKTPSNTNDVCHVFKQYPRWYRDAKDVENRWKIPVAVQMAIIYQESGFNANAQPPRTKLLNIIPWSRPSSAYGFSQALRGTWMQYKKVHGNFFSSRDNFGDAVNFIGWYANQANRRAEISRQDAYNLYLAYHEGIGGFQRKTYLKKQWLISTARRVKARAHMYEMQLSSCKR